MGPATTTEMAAYLASDDFGGLAECLAAMAERFGGNWQYGPEDVLRVLREDVPVQDRERLVQAVASAAAPRTPMASAGEGTSDLAVFLARWWEVPIPPLPYGNNLARIGSEWHYRDHEILVAVVENELDKGASVPGPVVATLRRNAHERHWQSDHLTALLARVDREAPVLSPGEAWADLATAEARGAVWQRLLGYARTAQTAKPTKKWERGGREILDEIGAETAAAALVRWLALVGRPRTLVVAEPWEGSTLNAQFDPHNAVALRGLVWLLAFTPETPETARVLGRLTETALRRVPGLGPVQPKVANAAVYALSRLGGEASVAQLARLSTKLTYRGTLKEVTTALDARAAALGITRAEVEELAVPAFGLTDIGRRVDVFGGGASAELAVSGGTVALTWRNTAGRIVKSPPAEVRRDHAEQVAELKASAKDMAKMLTAQSERLDRQFLARRTWRFDQWRERLLDHPLVGTLARRLLWTVDGRVHGFADGSLRTLDDAAATPGADAEVRLWHPVESPAGEVAAARAWLERHLVAQPFRQAHREVYPLTAAEEETRDYSNRYAGHVLRQYPFHALAAVRGWTDKLRMHEDAEFPPTTRMLPEWGLRAEFWVAGHGEETGNGSAFAYLGTDQVRFYAIDAPVNSAHASHGRYGPAAGSRVQQVAPLPLASIPPLVFSEVMRDADLFVGVASVGNDPTWEDGGPHGHHRAYWASYNQGELTATAVTRRELLARLLPRLAIGARCELDGRYLRVTGTLRSYAIHLGSGNVLMNPDGRYLCLVPKNPGSPNPDGMYLPYEGDQTLALILSKAVLLADDHLITDPDITRQFPSPGPGLHVVTN